MPAFRNSIHSRSRGLGGSSLKTLVSCRARYALPGDPTKDLYLLPVSGGGDSAALAILLHTMFPEIPFRMVFTDTLAEDPEIYDVLDRLERYVGRQIERIVPEKGLFQLVDDYNGYLPSPQARWCTSYGDSDSVNSMANSHTMRHYASLH